MSFLQHLLRCNRHDLAGFIPFRVDGVVVGQIRPGFASLLSAWPEVFAVMPDGIELAVASPDMDERSAAVAGVLQALADQGVLSPLHGEQYGATAHSRDDGVLLIDRAAAPCFGIRAFGQHLNGYVRKGSSYHMWIGRRAADRMIYPGRLDHLVAGGLPHGIGLAENLAKECREEAAIPPQLVSRAIPVGTVSYIAESERGLKPDTLYCYDLELPADFQPCCTDGEVDEFYLWPVEQVMEVVKETREFKQNCNLVIIDFLIRHGFIEPEHEDYLDLVTGLHPVLP